MVEAVVGSNKQIKARRGSWRLKGIKNIKSLQQRSMIEAKGQEVRASRQVVTVEVSSHSGSSGYRNSTEYSPLSENQNEDDMTSASEEEDRPIDIEEVNQTPKVCGDALLVEPNPDLGDALNHYG